MLNSQASRTLPTLAIQDAICFREVGGPICSNTGQGTPISRKWGKGKPEIRQKIERTEPGAQEFGIQLRKLINGLGAIVNSAWVEGSACTPTYFSVADRKE